MSVTADQVRALYETTLKPRIDGLESVRRALKGYVIKTVVLLGIPFALFVVGDWCRSSSGLPFSIVASAAFALIFVCRLIVAAKIYLVPGATAFLNYKARYKREVVSEVFRIVVPTAEYDPFKGIAQAVYSTSPGSSTRAAGLRATTAVRGWIGETPFEAADVHSTYETGTGKNSRTHVVFKGLFFHLDFNKAVRGTTIVQPQSPWLVAGRRPQRDGGRLPRASGVREGVQGLHDGRRRSARPPDADNAGTPARGPRTRRASDLPGVQEQPRLHRHPLRPAALRATGRKHDLARRRPGGRRSLCVGRNHRPGTGPEHADLERRRRVVARSAG